MLKKALLALLFCLAWSPAFAQSSACPYPLQYGQVLTTAQWNACLSAGIDALPLSGGTLTGKLSTSPSLSTGAGFNLPPGVAPADPANGDLWTTTNGFFAQINGTTKGPFIATATASPAQGDVLFYDGAVWRDLGVGTSGQFLETLGIGANPLWATPPSASGCSITGSQYQIVTVNSAGNGCTPDGSGSINAGALTLGASGTPGSVQFGNATSGTLTLEPVTGALGSVTVSVPAATDTLVNLASAQTLTNKSIAANEVNSGTLAAAQMPAFTGDVTSSTGSTALTLANTGVTAGSYTSANITIDAKGRITAAASSSTSQYPKIVYSGNFSGTSLVLNLSAYPGSSYGTIIIYLENISGGFSLINMQMSSDGGSTFHTGSTDYYSDGYYFSGGAVVPYGSSGSSIPVGYNSDSDATIKLSLASATRATATISAAGSSTLFGSGYAAGSFSCNAVVFNFSGSVTGRYKVVAYQN